MRSDGRAADELRAVRFEVDFTEQPLCSVLCRVGRTTVLCTVCEELSVPRFLAGSGRGWVTAEYSMLPGATDTRGEREASRGRPSGRTQEIQRLVGRSLRSIAALDRMGECTIWIDCDVLQADGGTRTASITAGYLALAQAVFRLSDAGTLKPDVLVDSVAAVSVGIVGEELLLDLCYEEDSRAEVDFNVVMTGGGGLVEVQGTAEGTPFTRSQLDALMDLASEGVAELTAFQRDVLSG